MKVHGLFCLNLKVYDLFGIFSFLKIEKATPFLKQYDDIRQNKISQVKVRYTNELRNK